MKRPNRSQIVCSELMTKFNAAFWWNFSFSFYSLFFSQKDERKKCPTDRWTSEIRQSGSLGRWDKRIVYQVSDVPSIIFFSWFLAKFFAKILSIYFLISYKITKMKIKVLSALRKKILGTSYFCTSFKNAIC